MLPQTPHAGTAESPATPSRLERRRKRRKAKTVLTIDPAVRRAVKAAIRRQGFSTLGGIMERLLVLWLRSDWRQRSHMVGLGYYRPDQSHAGNAELLTKSMAEVMDSPTADHVRPLLSLNGWTLEHSNGERSDLYINRSRRTMSYGRHTPIRVLVEWLERNDAASQDRRSHWSDDGRPRHSRCRGSGVGLSRRA